MKIKKEKGITLVALIITIVVLLILAMVAIGAITDSNIIGHAGNASSGYNTAKDEENSMLAGYDEILSQYANGNNSAGNNGGTGNNPGGDNNGEIDEPEITPPEVEEPDPTPPAPVYYSKTLNTNLNDYADALACGDRTGGNSSNDYIYNPRKKITYISGTSKIVVELRSGTAMESFSVIYVVYTDTQGNVSRYAICNPEVPWTLEDHKVPGGQDNYVPAGYWTKPSGEKYTNNHGESNGDIYEPITQIPVFEGEWQIDEANTTAEGKQYLSNVLIDVTN